MRSHVLCARGKPHIPIVGVALGAGARRAAVPSPSRRRRRGRGYAAAAARRFRRARAHARDASVREAARGAPDRGPPPHRGDHCVPVAAARWGGGVPTLRRRQPSGRPPEASPTRAHAWRRRGAPAGWGDDDRQRGAVSGVPQTRPGATPSGGRGEASGSAAVGGPTAPHRGRPWRRPPAGLRHGNGAQLLTPRRRGRNAAVASATALMGTPVDAAAMAVAPVAAGRGGSGATSPSGGRAAPRAQPPRRSPRDGRWWLPRRRRRRARAPPPRGIRPPRPPPPPRPAPLRPQPRPLPATAYRCASRARSSTAHRRVGGRRGGNTASGGGGPPRRPCAGEPRVPRCARPGSRERERECGLARGERPVGARTGEPPTNKVQGRRPAPTKDSETCLSESTIASSS